MIGDQPKIGSFFKPISSRMHSLKMQEQQILVEETVKKRAEEKAEKEAAKKAQLAAEKSHREQVRALQLKIYTEELASYSDKALAFSSCSLYYLL